jgi:hypothetical protein
MRWRDRWAICWPSICLGILIECVIMPGQHRGMFALGALLALLSLVNAWRET